MTKLQTATIEYPDGKKYSGEVLNDTPMDKALQLDHPGIDMKADSSRGSITALVELNSLTVPHIKEITRMVSSMALDDLSTLMEPHMKAGSPVEKNMAEEL